MPVPLDPSAAHTFPTGNAPSQLQLVMRNARARHPIASVGALGAVMLLVGCVQPQPVAIVSASTPPSTPHVTPPIVAANNPNFFSFTTPPTPGRPVVFHWRGNSYDGTDAFIAGVTTRVAEMVAPLRPNGEPKGSLRLVLPVRSAVAAAGGEIKPGEAAVAQARGIIDQGRVTALRNAALFEPITVEVGSIAIPDAGTSDFVLWFTDGFWNLRYRRGDPKRFPDQNDLAIWLGAVRAQSQLALQGPGEPSLGLTITYQSNTPDRVSYRFNGEDYSANEPLIPAMKAAFDDAAARIPPMAGRLGGRIKIVLTSTITPLPNTVPLLARNRPQQSPAIAAVIAEANAAHWHASVAAKVEAMRRSRLFDEVVVETAEHDDVALAGFDYVMWQLPGKPYAWRYRTKLKGNDAWTLTQPRDWDLQPWLDAVRQQLGAPK